MIGYAGNISSFLDKLRWQGKEFFHQEVYAIASGATKNFLIDYSTHISGRGLIVVIPGFFHTTYGAVLIQIYRGSEYSGGDAIGFFCTNTSYNNELETTVTTGATGTVIGTLTEERIAGSGSTNQSSGGDSSQSGCTFIRHNAGKTLINVVNQSGKDTQLTFAQCFYEV